MASNTKNGPRTDKNGVGAGNSVKINLYSFMTSLGYSVSHVL